MTKKKTKKKTESKMTELYKKHRPKTLKEVVGQPSVVKMLEAKIKSKSVPHTLLFTGPSGCGKTTLARILRRALRCGKADFVELNCADMRGIDMVRSIRQRVSQAPISGDCRIWLIDECHKMTSDAANAFLKLLEDTPKHVYFMLATTDPQKVLKTIKTRATEVKVNTLRNSSLKKLIADVVKKEGISVTEEVVDKIIDCSEGSARKALVLLNQIIGLDDEDDQLENIQRPATERAAFDIARALGNFRTKWADMITILKEIKDEDPESIRWMVMAYGTSMMLGKAHARGYLIVEAFRDPFYDSKRAGLVAACYEVICGGD